MNTFLSNRQYDVIKAIALYIVPPVVLFLATFTEIWGIPYGHQLTQSVAAIGTLLGGVIGITSRAYAPPEALVDGVLHITPTGEAYAAIEASIEDALDRGTTTLSVRRLEE